jgi:hypothetical protein
MESKFDPLPAQRGLLRGQEPQVSFQKLQGFSVRAPKIGHFHLVLLRNLDQTFYLIVVLDDRSSQGFYNPSKAIESLVSSHFMLLPLVTA